MLAQIRDPEQDYGVMRLQNAADWAATGQITKSGELPHAEVSQLCG